MARGDERAFVLLPTQDFESTEVFEVLKDGSTELRWTIDDWSCSRCRVGRGRLRFTPARLVLRQLTLSPSIVASAHAVVCCSEHSVTLRRRSPPTAAGDAR